MASDDEVSDDTSSDPTFATAGPRRSTFTPPSAESQQASSDGVNEESTDDDALADALAADLERIAASMTGTIPVITSRQAEPPAAPAPAVTPPPPFSPPANGPVRSTEPPPWSALPAPDPSQAVSLPDGPPKPPVRRSLPDEELLDWVDDAGREPGGTLNVIEQLESQLKLREEEARQFRAWESTMLNLGTPDAIDAVENARPEFTGVLPNVPAPPGLQTPPAPETESFIRPEEPIAEWPVPHFDEEEPAVEEPAVEELVPEALVSEAPVSEEPSVEEPEFEAPVSDAPLSEEPVSDAPVFAEPVSEIPAFAPPESDEAGLAEPVFEAPVFEAPVSEVPVFDEPVADAPVFEEPVFQLDTGASIVGRNELHLDFGQQGGIELPIRSNAPCQHNS